MQRDMHNACWSTLRCMAWLDGRQGNGRGQRVDHWLAKAQRLLLVAWQGQAQHAVARATANSPRLLLPQLLPC